MNENPITSQPTPEELESLSTQVQHALQPIAAPSAFRARLRDGLTLAARSSQSQKILSESSKPGWGWVLGAAAIGSAAGLIAVVWRARFGHRPLTQSPGEDSSD